jgi:hypothetical protein
MYRFSHLSLASLVVFVLTACATAPEESSPDAAQPSYPAPLPATSAPTVTPQPTQAVLPTEKSRLPSPVEAAQNYLANHLGIPADQIVLEDTQETEWPDSCLGLASPKELCADVIVPGYILIFSTPLGSYEIHIDQTGSSMRIAQPQLGIDPKNVGSGIEGQVIIGPNCGGPAGSTECADKPYQATITVLDEKGQETLIFQTDAEGRFKVDLAPGVYTLRPHSEGRFPMAAEQMVTVEVGQYAQIIITYDTGLR